MAKDRRDDSAETATWWPEFVRVYGTVSLRELARRFDTNPRRLRRAAQRSGLTSEPEALRSHLERLGREPDATLAADLGTTAEEIAGARRRRDIPPFVTEPAAPAAEPAPAPEPGLAAATGTPRPRKKRRFEPPAEVVVVRKGARAQVMETHEPAPLAAVPESPAPAPVAPAATENPTAPARRRRRIVKTEERVELAPEPEPPKKPRRRIQKKAPPVRIVFDRKQDIGELPAPAPPVVQPVPASAPALRPEPAPEPTPVVAAPPAAVWTARVETAGGTRDLVILAGDLVAAATRAAAEGTVLAVERAPTL